MKLNTLVAELSKLKQQNTEEEFVRTRKQYFSLPKLNSVIKTNAHGKLHDIQICKFPEKLFMDGSIGFKKFKTLDRNELKKNKNSLNSILDCIHENNRQVETFNNKYIKQKQRLLTTIEQSFQKQKKLTADIIPRPLNKSQLTILKIKKAEVETKKNKSFQCSEYLQSIIHPQYKNQIKKKQQARMIIQTKKRNQFMVRLQVQLNINCINYFGQSPQCRQGCQTIYLNNKLYVLGGSSNSSNHYIQYLDFRNNEWNKLEIPNYRRRSFHVALKDQKNQIIIIGGYLESTLNQKRKLATTIQILNLEMKDIKPIEIPNFQIIQSRYGHSALLIENNKLLITGGRNTEHYFKDSFIISLQQKKIDKIFDLPFQSGISSHSVCFNGQTAYLFGGRRGDGQLSNKMFEFNQKKKKFIELITYGKRPHESYGHSMTYYAKLNVILIFGGRNDSFNNPFLNQFFLFHIGLSMYTRIEQMHIKLLSNNLKQIPRICFGANYKQDNQLYLYGGLNLEGLNKKLYRLDLQMQLKNFYKME